MISNSFNSSANNEGDWYFTFVYSTIDDYRDHLLSEAPLIEVSELIDHSFTYSLLGFTIKISESNATIISGKYHFGFEIVD